MPFSLARLSISNLLAIAVIAFAEGPSRSADLGPLEGVGLVCRDGSSVSNEISYGDMGGIEVGGAAGPSFVWRIKPGSSGLVVAQR